MQAIVQGPSECWLGSVRQGEEKGTAPGEKETGDGNRSGDPADK